MIFPSMQFKLQIKSNFCNIEKCSFLRAPQNHSLKAVPLQDHLVCVQWKIIIYFMIVLLYFYYIIYIIHIMYYIIFHCIPGARFSYFTQPYAEGERSQFISTAINCSNFNSNKLLRAMRQFFRATSRWHCSPRHRSRSCLPPLPALSGLETQVGLARRENNH